MPIYEYYCKKCDKTFEVMQKFSDPPVNECPDCKGGVTKMVSRTSFQLKGTGWYATDYKKPTPSSKSAPPDPTAKPKEAETKVEKKPNPGGGSDSK